MGGRSAAPHGSIIMTRQLIQPEIPAAQTAAIVTGRRGLRSRFGGVANMRDAAANQMFLVPVILVFVVLLVIPLSQSVMWSFTDFTGYSNEAQFVGFENYRIIFTDPSMLAGVAFTLFFAVGTTLLTTAIAIPLAVIINERFFGRNFVRSIFFFPAIPSMAVLGLVWAYILSPLGTGVLNTVLDTLFGIGPFPWLSNSTLAQISVVVVGVWGAAGWHAMIYLAYLQSIPTEYYEVARIDGTTGRQRFFYITLPLLAPAIAISQFLLLTNGLKVFDLPYTLTGGGPGFATFTITQSIITSGVAQGRYGIASALAVVFTVAVAVIALLQLVLLRRIEGRVS